jgi:hypothetical protein
MPGDQRGQLPREAAGGSHRRNRKGKRLAVAGSPEPKRRGFSGMSLL